MLKKTMQLAPIVIFTYNRPWHTQQTIEALLQNEYAAESDLIVYSDSPKNENAQAGVEETRKYIASIKGFKSLRIIERTENYGLANNIVDGVTSVVNEFGRIIVLEDDLLTSPYFLKFMNEALNLYESTEEVISVHGYIYPIKRDLPETFFIKGADCLGWGTWKRGWNLFNPNGSELLKQLVALRKTKDFDFCGSYPFTKMLQDQVSNKIGSWAIRWHASAFLNSKLTLYPGRSLIFHNGSDGSGTNCGTSEEFDVKLSLTPIDVLPINKIESVIGKKRFVYYYRYVIPYYRIKNKCLKLLRYGFNLK